MFQFKACVRLFSFTIINCNDIFKLIIVGNVLSIFIVPFFMVHYGGFMAGHLVFLVALFGPKGIGIFHLMKQTFFNVLPAVIFLLASHGFSFFYNFIGKGEYKNTDLEKQMSAPYRRIMLMHLTVIFGGWCVMGFGTPVAGLIVMILFKIIMDVYAHTNEHRQAA